MPVSRLRSGGMAKAGLLMEFRNKWLKCQRQTRPRAPSSVYRKVAESAKANIAGLDQSRHARGDPNRPVGAIFISDRGARILPGGRMHVDLGEALGQMGNNAYEPAGPHRPGPGQAEY